MHNFPTADLESVARRGGRFKRMAVRIPTYLTDLRENPAWLPMFLLARTLPFRRMHWFATRQRVKLAASGASMFAGVDRKDVVDALRSDGIFPGLTLPDHIHRQIAEFALTTSCFGNFSRKLEFAAGDHREAEARFERPILSGHFFERSLDCEAVMAVQRDPLLIDVARQYLGGQAKVITTRIWWSFPTQASEADRSLASLDKYHFDLDDWRMLKFFFNLVDVDEGTGPHVFVKGSHKRRRVRHQLTLLVGHPASEVLDYYGEANALTLTGKAGSGFVEDPFGFHMGTVPTQRPRLMMEVGFGVSKPSRRRFHGEPVLR
ncbi:phytanoyl-CoA dioxygenase family protein [Rhizobium lusitanum]|uniref:Phytanoyl-CoA dioxygenase (PhyH) n=1 Tax=Rhizobium lusitanum TaxID=293958 RepID=A0A7X0IR23_9HYPH|nr:phytanoyl-CoA dioxygenase family protein [Rhizobium lusitanum]MBB6485583.1 hypothetical protein [Rhizobium lusitanum]